MGNFVNLEFRIVVDDVFKHLEDLFGDKRCPAAGMALPPVTHGLYSCFMEIFSPREVVMMPAAYSGNGHSMTLRHRFVEVLCRRCRIVELHF